MPRKRITRIRYQVICVETNEVMGEYGLKAKAVHLLSWLRLVESEQLKAREAAYQFSTPPRTYRTQTIVYCPKPGE